MALDALSAGINAGLSQGYASGGSAQHATSAGSGYSNSDAQQAQQFSAEQARIAFERQKELMNMEMEYNSKEAEKARQWNENMANSVYTRSVNNMREAGINPILAANMGLSAASVGSGQTASIGGASAPMAQGFMGSSSEWNNRSESEGSSYNKSEQGIITALEGLGAILGKAMGSVQSALNLNISMDGLKNAMKSYDDIVKSIPERTVEQSVGELAQVKDVKSLVDWTLKELNPLNSPFVQTIKNNHTAEIWEVDPKTGKRIKKVHPKG